MWVTYGDDEELSESRKSPGEFSPLTRKNGDPAIFSHVTLSPIDDEDDEGRYDKVPYVPLTEEEKAAMRAHDASQSVLAEEVLKLAAAAVKAAEPHVTDWIVNQAIPSVRSAWSKVTRTSKKAGPEPTPAPPADPEQIAREVAAALGDYRSGIGIPQARTRIVAALAGRTSDEGAGMAALDRAPATLTDKEIGDGIRSVLEANPSLLDEIALTDLRRILEGGHNAYRDRA
ncbi:hypothetical protein ACTI_44320 [Actinoplanes sp. OR16]|nr:hypothetical protein ACTI_44320 [Actinoplanes sp. OR16]